MLLSFSTVWPAPRNSHLVVSSPSTPTGPRAWMRDVLMPTSAPSPNLKPSAKRVVALWKTHALSTRRRKSSALDWLPAVQRGSAAILQFTNKLTPAVLCTISGKT